MTKSEIKFRQAIFHNNKFLGYFHYWGFNVADEGGFVKPFMLVPSEQFTGLQDKNGKEIYDGDDISFSISQTQYYKGYVKWSKKSLCYLVHCYWEKQDEVSHISACVRKLDKECFDIEVIGNIHDNPELFRKANIND